jgi:uncharacterized protein
MLNLRNLLQALVLTIVVSIQAAHGQALDELLRAADDGDLRRVAFYLDRGLDPNSSDADGITILMRASRVGHAEMASFLVSRKASLGRQTSTGDTALMMACLGGHFPVVKLLVEAGAPLANGKGWQPLHYAAFGGSAETVRFLLDRGADKNALAPNLYTPLMLAARNGHADAARELLLHKADVSQRGQADETALGIAKRKEDQTMIELLKRAGAVD